MNFETDTILKLAPGVWIQNAVDNCMWADLGDGVLVVDALEDESMAPLIAEDVQATAGRPMLWVVNTHGDRDHVACNATWAAQGATVIAHRTIAEAMAGQPGCPQIVFDDRYTVDGARYEANLRWLGGAHSPADTVVYLPHSKILHVGDLFSWGLIPIPALTDARAARLIEVLGAILEYDADIVVCGHGPVLTLDHVRRWLTYFSDLRANVSSLASQDLAASDIALRCPAPEDMRDWWRFVDWKHRRNIGILMGEKGTRE